MALLLRRAVPSALLVAVAAIGFRYYQSRDIPLSCPERIALSEVSTKGLPPDWFSKGMIADIDACLVYSETYTEARAKFRQAARDAGGELHQLPVTEGSDDYTVDVAVLPGRGLGLVVHTSGVHGIEGFAGSAVQVAFLKTVAAAARRRSDGDGAPEVDSFSALPTVVLVHAFNPHGMANYRRVNENNVDLNRNGLRDFGPTVRESYYNRANYERFGALFNPSPPPSRGGGLALVTTSLLLWLRFASNVLRHGLPRLKAAMVGGQYHDPRGIFYGGDELQSSYRVLEAWLVDFLSSRAASYDSSDGPSAVATWVDVHTGLGPSGEDTMIPHSRYLPPNWVASQIQEWFPSSHHPAASSTGSHVTQGYEQVLGHVGDYFAPILRDHSVSTLFVVQEFGTLPLPLVGHALIVENAAAMAVVGITDPEFQSEAAARHRWWAQRTLRPAFYPSHPAWRASIVQRGLNALLQSLRRSSSLTGDAVPRVTLS